MQNLDEPIKGIGIPEVARACGVSERAVYKWLKNGFLPKTEFFGKTRYASKIEEISGGKFQAVDLLEISKKNSFISISFNTSFHNGHSSYVAEKRTPDNKSTTGLCASAHSHN